MNEKDWREEKKIREGERRRGRERMREGGSERVIVGERKRERKKVADPKYDPICIRVATMGSERRLRQKPAKKYSKTNNRKQ